MVRIEEDAEDADRRRKEVAEDICTLWHLSKEETGGMVGAIGGARWYAEGYG